MYTFTHIHTHAYINTYIYDSHYKYGVFTLHTYIHTYIHTREVVTHLTKQWLLQCSCCDTLT